MKKIVVLLMTLVMCVGLVSASPTTVTKELTYKGVQVTLDGKKLELAHEPFSFDGTNYLPVRDICEALGLTVKWDGSTNTIILTTTPPAATTPSPQVPVDEGPTIYITKTGKRYHYDNHCNGGTYIPSTLAKAKELKLTACDKCVMKSAA